MNSSDRDRDEPDTAEPNGRSGAGLLLAFIGDDAPDELAGLLDRIVGDRAGQLELVAIRDREGAGFYRGAEDLGDTIESTASALGAIVAARAPRAVITFGVGAGGHAALVFGVLLGAGRIVAVEPAAHLIADELARYNDRRWQRVLSELPDPELARRYEVPALMERTAFAGRALILLGTLRRDDHHDAVHQSAIHAQRLARSDRVTLCPFPNTGQDVLVSWIRGGNAESMLAHYLFGDVAAPAYSDALAPPGRETLRISSKLHQRFTYEICVPNRDRYDEDNAGHDVIFAAAGTVDPSATQKINDAWRQWIAGNLMLGASPVSLEDTLVGNGFSDQEATREVWNAMQSPYLWGSQRLQNRLKKRDWLLAAYRKLRRVDPRSAEIPRRYKLSRSKFLEEYYCTNRPVIISSMIDDWPATARWGPDSLARRFGDRDVEVEFALDPDIRVGLDLDLGRATEVRTMPMADFVTLLRRDGTAGGVSLSAGEGSANHVALAGLWDDVGPLAGYLDDREPPGGTIRVGSAGSSVPFRLALANTLVAQVLGRARIKLAPSWDLPLMHNSAHVFSRLDGRSTPAAPRVPPGEPEPQILECLLEPGEVLFLPVGSWSYMEALEVTAAVSFTNLAFENDFAESFPADTAS